MTNVPYFNIFLFRNETDFGNISYWQKKYESDPYELYEWYKDLKGDELLSIYFPCCQQNLLKKILILGSGNSIFSNKLYQMGFQNIYNVDCCYFVLKQIAFKFPQEKIESKFFVIFPGTLIFC